jgi:hypothetical protein
MTSAAASNSATDEVEHSKARVPVKDNLQNLGRCRKCLLTMLESDNDERAEAAPFENGGSSLCIFNDCNISDVDISRPDASLRQEIHDTHCMPEVHILFSIVVPRMASTYTISGASLFHLEHVCRRGLQRHPADIMFRQWLCAHEAGVDTIHTDTRRLYRAYHAARLQCGFMRSVLHHDSTYLKHPGLSVVRLNNKSAIAGSYPAAMYLIQERSRCHWRPTDIDFFFSDSISLVSAMKSYSAEVLAPLGLTSAFTCTNWDCWPSDPCYSESEDASGFHADLRFSSLRHLLRSSEKCTSVCRAILKEFPAEY